MKLITKLLKFKGFKAVSLWFEGKGGSDIVVAVKPHKKGCRCPQCGRRGKIVRTMPPGAVPMREHPAVVPEKRPVLASPAQSRADPRLQQGHRIAPSRPPGTAVW